MDKRKTMEECCKRNLRNLEEEVEPSSETTVLTGILLKRRINTLKDIAEGKTHFREFGTVKERASFMDNLRKYIAHANHLSSPEFDSNVTIIRQGWEFVKGVLPLMFEFPPKSKWENGNSSQLVHKLRLTVNLLMPHEDKNDYERRMLYYKDTRIKNLEPVKRFVDRHMNSGMFMASEGVDEDINQIIEAYEKTLNRLDKFSRQDFDDLMELAGILPGYKK